MTSKMSANVSGWSWLDAQVRTHLASFCLVGVPELVEVGQEAIGDLGAEIGVIGVGGFG